MGRRARRLQAASDASPHPRDHCPSRHPAVRVSSPQRPLRPPEARASDVPRPCLEACRSSLPLARLVHRLHSSTIGLRVVPPLDSTSPAHSAHLPRSRASIEPLLYTIGQKYSYSGEPDLYSGPYSTNRRVHIIAGMLW